MNQPKVYLTAKYFAKPRKPNATVIPGYMKDPGNVAFNEQVNIVVGLKSKTLIDSKVVLNITDQKVEKNGFKTDKSFLELFQYFYEANPQDLSRALKSVGIIVGSKSDGSEHVSEDVQTETEEGQGPEPAATADSTGTS